MKEIFEISKLLIKQELKTLTSKEKSLLESYSKNFPFIKEIDFDKMARKKADYTTIDKNKAWDAIIKKSTNLNSKKPLLLSVIRPWIKYAALIVIFFGSGYFLHVNNYFSSEPDFILPEDHITIQLENGDIEFITEGGQTKVVDSKGNTVGSQKGNQLVYKEGLAKENLVHNTVSIPYGRTFELVLSDGTEIFLNAGTTLRYPVKFTKASDRKVFLNGEAFFKVTSSKNEPFIVVANNLNTKVYGTSFNISSYQNDFETKVVLVEGLVGVYKKDSDTDGLEDKYLNPNQMAVSMVGQSIITVDEVDTFQHTAWMEDTFVFASESFDNIFKRLERHYNVTIKFNEESLMGERFTGTFHDKEIEYILNIIKKNIEFEYEIVKNKIIINS